MLCYFFMHRGTGGFEDYMAHDDAGLTYWFLKACRDCLTPLS